jgi:hypothetical protein
MDVREPEDVVYDSFPVPLAQMNIFRPKQKRRLWIGQDDEIKLNLCNQTQMMKQEEMKS